MTVLASKSQFMPKTKLCSWKAGRPAAVQVSGISKFLVSFPSATAISIAVGRKNLLRQVSLMLPLGGNGQWHDLLGLFVRMQKMEAGRRAEIPAAPPPLLVRYKWWTFLQGKQAERNPYASQESQWGTCLWLLCAILWWWVFGTCFQPGLSINIPGLSYICSSIWKRQFVMIRAIRSLCGSETSSC